MNRYYGPAGGTGGVASAGWTLRRLTEPAVLFGSNGMRIAPDGRLVIGQAVAGAVTAISLQNGDVERLVPVGGPLNRPDDLAFASDGTMYIADTTPGRVWARSPSGELHCAVDGVPFVNGITVENDRIFVDECREGGRLMEVFPDGRPPRVIAEDLPLPNALGLGPDGHLYLPLVFAGEVWRFAVDGSHAERFLSDLAHPVAVKFSPSGRLTVLEGRTGVVSETSITDPQLRQIGVAAPGSDNFEFDNDNGRILVSSYASGSITAIDRDGRTEAIVAPAFVRPFGIAVADDGDVYAADGGSVAVVASDGTISRVATNADRHLGVPGYFRAVCCGPPGVLYTTCTWPTGNRGAATVHRFEPATPEWTPISDDAAGPAGIARHVDGSLVIADAEDGCVRKLDESLRPSVLGDGFERPLGVALLGDECFVTDAAKGAVFQVGTSKPLVEGLVRPEGIAATDDRIYVLDSGAQTLYGYSLRDKELEQVVTELPIGPPPGSPSSAIGDDGTGLISPFCGLAIGRDGSIYIAADGEGSILCATPASAETRSYA